MVTVNAFRTFARKKLQEAKEKTASLATATVATAHSIKSTVPKVYVNVPFSFNDKASEDRAMEIHNDAQYVEKQVDMQDTLQAQLRTAMSSYVVAEEGIISLDSINDSLAYTVFNLQESLHVAEKIPQHLEDMEDLIFDICSVFFPSTDEKEEKIVNNTNTRSTLAKLTNMRPRIWEDKNAMKIVSVLGYLLNNEGKIVGKERTHILCKMMPSIHTLTHRAIIGMLITGLAEADAIAFFQARGLLVLNEWLQESNALLKHENIEKEKIRVEIFSQVKALLRIMDVNIQTDNARRQNAYINNTLQSLIAILDAPGPEYVTEWSQLTTYRRQFETSCESLPASVTMKPVSSSASQAMKAPLSTSTREINSSNLQKHAMNTAQPTNSSPVSASSKQPVASLLDYQVKTFLQRSISNEEQRQSLNIVKEEENEEDESPESQLITNTPQSLSNASLDQKIRSQGHVMIYGERNHCQSCRRMNAKRCRRCGFCVKCSQKERCSNDITFDMLRPSDNLSVKDRNQQVLGSAMDQAIYKAFKQQEFHSVFSLIENDMDVNFQRIESDHSTALMAAAHHGREDVTKKLLSLGANPCLTDQNGHEAWVFAERKGHKDLMELLKSKADECRKKELE